MANDDLLSAAQAARLLHVTDETLRRWADQEKIRHIKLPSGQIRFRRSDVDAILTPVEPRGSVA